MNDHATPSQTAAEALHRLRQLREDLADPAEVAAAGRQYVGLAVTEIATLRAELSGPLAG